MILIKVLACLAFFSVILSAPALTNAKNNSNNENNDYDIHELGKLMIDSHSSQFITEPLSHHVTGPGMQIHENSMQLLVKREEAINKQHMEQEIAYEEHMLTYSALSNKKRRSHFESQRRVAATTIFQPFKLAVVAGYWSAVVINLSIGTPEQLLKMILDFGAVHTLVPSASLCTSPVNNHRKRDICHYSNGFDAAASSSVSRSPNLMKDTDFNQPSKRDILTIKKRSGSESINDFLVEAIKDEVAVMIIAGYTLAHMTIHFYQYYFMPHVYSNPSTPPSSSLAQPATQAPLGILAGGVAQYFPHNDANHLSTHASIWTWLSSFSDTDPDTETAPVVPVVSPPVAPPAPVEGNMMAYMICSPVNSDGSTENGDPSQRRKRNVPCVPELSGGKINLDKTASPFIRALVVPPTGFAYQSTFIVQVRTVSMASTTGKPWPAASIAINLNSDASTSFGQAVISTWESYIRLTYANVKAAYGTMLPSLYREPTTPQGLWLYRCGIQPIIRFEFVDSNSKPQLLSMNPVDSFHGFAINSLGWCNGAIQALPTGATQQIIGLSFSRSFYTALEYGHINYIPQALGVSLAVSARV